MLILILVGAVGPWKHCVDIDIGRSSGAVEALC